MDEILKYANLDNDNHDEYIKTLDIFDNVLKEAIHLSKKFSGIKSPTSQHFYASVLFTALCVRGISLVSLAPFSSWSDKKIEQWDYATCSNITRTILELRLCFFYLCTEICDTQEWECRWNIFNLHDCTSRIRLFTALDNQKQVEQLTLQSEQLKNRLKSNAFFLTLKSGEQKNYLNGQKAYMCPLEEIAEKIDIERSQFRWLYTFFSSHVHALPMSFYRIGDNGDERGKGLPSYIEVTYTSLCLSLSSKLLKGSINEMKILFANFDDSAPPNSNTEDTSDTLITSPLAIGESHEIFSNETIKIQYKKENEELIKLDYLFQKNNDVILSKVLTETQDEIVYIDPFFWKIEVNNMPSTESIFLSIINGEAPFAYQIDHNNFTIRIKTE